MRFFGQGAAALVDDPATADRLGWSARRRSRPDPEVVLAAREGDPRREPWIAPPWYRPALGLESLRRRTRCRPTWSYLGGAPGVLRCLARLSRPRAAAGWRVGLTGLGRVGGVAATILAATPSGLSGIDELLIHDAIAANQERWLLELGSIARWRSGDRVAAVRAATPSEIFDRCDAFVFAASDTVPPPGASGDVRAVQFEPNRRILRGLLDNARDAAFTGLFMIVSDPIEALAQAAFHDSNSDRYGRFTGDGLAPERIAGLGLGVMWARALAAARRDGSEATVARSGAAYGPHSADVVVLDRPSQPNWERSAALSRAAGECNLRVRELGYVPYVGPGASSVGLMLPALLGGREALASVLVDGIYFGAPARLDWGVLPTSRRMGPEAFSAVSGLHARLAERLGSLGLRWRDP